MISDIVTGVYLLILAVSDLCGKTVRPVLLYCGAVPLLVSFIDIGANVSGGITWNGSPSPAARMLGLIPGLVLLAAARITKEQIGYADAVVICITGVILGITANIALLAGAFLFLLLYAIVLFAARRLHKGERVAFLPFVLLGYAACLFI